MRRTVVLAAILATACGTSATAPAGATTYETYLYSVSIPVEFGIAPLNDDPAYLWANPQTRYLGDTSSRSIGFDVEPAPGCTARQLRSYALDARARNRMADKSELVEVDLPFGIGAWFSGMAGLEPAAILFACDGTSLVTAFAIGLTPEQVDAVVTTFAFREPPGDPLRPPPRS